MKKGDYSKPMLAVEDMQLVDYIAGCATVITYSELLNEGSDRSTLALLGYYIEQWSQCKSYFTSTSDSDGDCYFTYTNGTFAS